MDSQERAQLKDRIRSWDNKQIDSYLNDVIEDFTIEQLKHAEFHISTTLDERLRAEYGKYPNKYPNSFLSAKEQETKERFMTERQADNMEYSNI